MEKNTVDNKQQLKTIILLYYGIVIGAIMYAIVIAVVRQFSEDIIELEIKRELILMIAGGLSILCFFLANYLYKKRLQELDYQSTLEQKLTKYKLAQIGYIGALEGATLFSITAYFFTGESLLLAFAGITVMLMFIKRPSNQRIFNELQLDPKEQMELN